MLAHITMHRIRFVGWLCVFACPDRYKNYQAFPRGPDHQPILAGVEITSPGAARLTGLDAFCQALLNLNVFVYVQ